MYQIDIVACLRASLNIKKAPNFLEILMRPLNRNLAIRLKIGLRADQEKNSLLMCILPCLLDPTLQTLKGLLIINAKGEENATNAFIERPHNGPKRLLSSLPSHKAYGIPDLHFDLHLLIDFDRFGAELHAYGHVVVV